MKPCTSKGAGDGAAVQQTVVPQLMLEQQAEGEKKKKPVPITVVPRLLHLHNTAAYLGVSEWTVRDLEAAGILPCIKIPIPNGGELRKLLFDRADLDRLIDGWKDQQ